VTSPHPAAIDQLPSVGDAAVCMGVFDGVHRGHLALVDETIRAAQARGLRSVALVFDPHPDEVVRPGTVIPRLATLAENLRRLAAAGIDAPLAIRFDPGLRALTPEDFLAAMAPAVRVRALVMTPESAFGRNRAGTPEAMAAHGRDAGFDLVLANRIVRDGDAPISSGRVRESLRTGQLVMAERLLGHPPFLEAVVASRSGDRLALACTYAAALPPIGRYRVGVGPASDDRAMEGVLVVDDGSIGLEGWSDPPATGDVLAMDLLERLA
jgi:riboflavin kinase/FMN adenylyltransferase